MKNKIRQIVIIGTAERWISRPIKALNDTSDLHVEHELYLSDRSSASETSLVSTPAKCDACPIEVSRFQRTTAPMNSTLGIPHSWILNNRNQVSIGLMSGF